MLRTKIAGVAVGMALASVWPQMAPAVEIESKVERITFTGRIQPVWYTSSIDDFQPSNEFGVRRARVALRLKLNDWVGAMVEYDLGNFGDSELKDAWFRLEPREGLGITLGQWKRRFDLFELTSSTQILVIERDGRIGRTIVPSLSALTEGLEFADRDIGAFLGVEGYDERLRFEFGITNGAGANTRAEVGEKAFQGRISFQPSTTQPWEINAGISAHPHRLGGTAPDSADVNYAPAVEGSVEYGKWKSGPHVQAGLIWGKNWNPALGGRHHDSPDFLTFQIIGAYKMLLANPRWFEAVEPLLRLCSTDPSYDADIVPTDVHFSRFNSGGVLLTPGVNLYISDRTRFMADVDIFVPDGEAQDNLATPADETDTEFSLKLASWFYF